MVVFYALGVDFVDLFKVLGFWVKALTEIVQIQELSGFDFVFGVLYVLKNGFLPYFRFGSDWLWNGLGF